MTRHAATSHPSGTAQRSTAVRAMSYVQRGRKGFDRIIAGDSSSDRFIKAALGAAGTSVFLSLLRSTPVGRLMARWAPMAVFAVLYQRMSEE